MKKIFLTGILFFSLISLHAQLQNIPARQGLEMEYTIFPMGQVFPCTLRLDSLTADYEGTLYIQKDASGNNQLAFDGKPADAIYLESENGQTRIWLLNNPDLPILLKVEKNPFGVDLQFERVK